jgi:hypothetical protein
VEPGFPIPEFTIIRRGIAMKFPTIAAAAAAQALGGSFANAQSGPTGSAGFATQIVADEGSSVPLMTTRAGRDSSQAVRPYDQRSKPDRK